MFGAASVSRNVWIQAHASNPFSKEPRVLSRRQTAIEAAAAGEQMIARPLSARLQIIVDGLSRCFGEFGSLRRYFVTIRLGAGGGAAAGEMTNVNQVFQPEGRSEPPNSA